MYEGCTLLDAIQLEVQAIIHLSDRSRILTLYWGINLSFQGGGALYYYVTMYHAINVYFCVPHLQLQWQLCRIEAAKKKELKELILCAPF